MRHERFGALLLAAAVGLAACGGNGTGPNENGNGSIPPPPPGTIHMQDDFFNPAVDTVEVGTQVTWRNQGAFAHNTRSDGGVWTSPDVNAGGTFSFTFDEPGEFPYHCSIHGSPGVGMAGRLVVIE